MHAYRDPINMGFFEDQADRGGLMPGACRGVFLTP